MRSLGAVIIPFVLSLSLSQFAAAATPAEVSRVVEPGKKVDDPRLGPLRTLGDKSHPWAPATTKADWEKQAQAIRQRVLVAAGLWPMPPKETLSPVIHGKIDRGDYTVEKVYFASMPGHYVSGNLYRPAKTEGKVPGVLCPHGHWADGRFYDAGETEAKRQIEQKGESTMAGARFPLQARMVGLARLGCIVFHYDMVGVADSQPIKHAAGFADAEAELRLQSALGLQTFNSIRALDFILSLPEVDANRVGITGASGGGTQTFMLGGVDPRPAVAFPAVMVSTNMQGGCVCENADLLRVGINNVAIAALFTPKPLAMSGAHDWTIDIEKAGLPELKQVYSLYGNADKVTARCFPQFGHNYNQVAREMMYNWFNAHLNLRRPAPVVEKDFVPIDPKDLSVFDGQHPRPSDGKNAVELRADLTRIAEMQFADLLPKEKAGLERYREIVGTAARVMLDGALPDGEALDTEMSGQETLAGGVQFMKGITTRREDKSRLLWVLLRPESFNGTVVLWFDGKGKAHLFGADGKPAAAVQKLLDAGNAVVSADLFLTGEFLESGSSATPKVNSKYAGFTFGYNRTLIANRVNDVLTAVVGLRKIDEVQKVRLIGTGDAGPCVLLAAALLGNRISEIIADARGLSYQRIPATDDPIFLPGALKYGGLGGLASLAAPTSLVLYGTEGIPTADLAPLATVYAVAGGSFTQESKPLTAAILADRLSKK